MSIEELIKEDSSFTESGFLAKVDNTFIMLLTAIMTDNMTRVEHKISKELFNKYSSIVNENNLNNERQISLMRKALMSLNNMLIDIDEISLDIVMFNLEEAFHYLCEIVGKDYQEDLIDHMFRNFCLGK